MQDKQKLQSRLQNTGIKHQLIRKETIETLQGVE